MGTSYIDGARSYAETVKFAVSRINERAVQRESTWLDAEGNYLNALFEMLAVVELIGYVYGKDDDTVIGDFERAEESYDGRIPKLRKPDFLKGRDRG